MRVMSLIYYSFCFRLDRVPRIVRVVVDAIPGGPGPAIPRPVRAELDDVHADTELSPERELSSELHYSGVSRRGLFSKAIRLGLYTCILYICIYKYTYI